MVIQTQLMERRQRLRPVLRHPAALDGAFQLLLEKGVTRRARGRRRAGPELKRAVGAWPGGSGRGPMEAIENAITRGTPP